MAKNPEIADYSGFEQNHEKKETKKPVDMSPGENSVQKFRKRGEEAQKNTEREKTEHILDIINSPLDSFESRFNGSNIRLGNNLLSVQFNGFRITNDSSVAAPIDKQGLSRDIREEKIKIGQVSCSFSIVSPEKGEPQRISISIPASRVIDCENATDLEALINSTFGGIRDRSQKVAMSTEKNPEQNKTNIDKKNSLKVQEQLQKLAAAKKMEISIMQSPAELLIHLRVSNEKSIHLSSNDLAIWSATTVDSGKIIGKTMTTKPMELLQASERA